MFNTGRTVSFVVATFGSLANDVFPDLSVALAVTLPSGIGLVGVISTTPCSLASPSPITLLAWSYKTTCDPFSAFTVTGV